MKKSFIQAPLPFQGQKRRFNAEFKRALRENFSADYAFVDLFGGSGLLSQWVREVFPTAFIVYNDFDDYNKRLRNIDRTNNLLREIRLLVQNETADKLISKKVRDQIINIIEKEELETGYVDYITLSSSLLFSMKYVTSLDELKKETFYCTVRKNDYENVTDYLNGVEVCRMDYKDLFARWKHIDKVVFLIDPPYLSTDCSTYSSYWRLSNYLDVLQTLQGTNYFYFTSNKSSILELTDWMSRNLNAIDPFKGASRVDAFVQMNKSAKYTDIMLYKKVK